LIIGPVTHDLKGAFEASLHSWVQLNMQIDTYKDLQQVWTVMMGRICLGMPVYIKAMQDSRYLKRVMSTCLITLVTREQPFVTNSSLPKPCPKDRGANMCTLGQLMVD